MLFSRNTTSGIRFAKANVQNVNGVILLPDNWSESIYNLNNTNDVNADYSSNVLYSWIAFENAGAIFLPAAGLREGHTLYQSHSQGFYWTTTHDDHFGGRAMNMHFTSSYLSTNGNEIRPRGLSVRLVCNAE